ncbi:hypothetical protein J3U66_09850 [Gilliamella sp. B2969]|uniref:hypothetical protein n=1 Tax=unclassified Gilliamella TaxID=2685620 RepID=UPI002269CBB2|nr:MULTISPECIES: hypothetical protein [unclassified Gilliamella]MCX8728426.1 hypothetical protein [Gilliamella sp. B2838]MCX8730677.1 hypothetical protein [Gilliamella sp. B2969]
MTKGYNLLKGTVSQLRVLDDPKELRSDDIGLLAIIGLMIVGAFELIGALIGAITAGSITLDGKSFRCYVGRKEVVGKLAHVNFKDGDYVEMLVKPIEVNEYQSDSVKMADYFAYAVRMPQYHALYFPRSVGMTTLLLLKYLSIGFGTILLFLYLIISTILYIPDRDISTIFIFAVSTIIMFFFLLISFFLMIGGLYTFISNRIFATLGYPKPWLHNYFKEHERFKKLNRSNDPELFDDPQTPEFERIKIRDPNANYYCRTPILPDWVEVIDERKFTPNLTTPNQEQSND